MSEFRETLKRDSGEGAFYGNLVGIAWVLEHFTLYLVAAFIIVPVMQSADWATEDLIAGDAGWVMITFILLELAIILIPMCLAFIVMFIRACQVIAGKRPRLVTGTIALSGWYLIWSWPRMSYGEFRYNCWPW